MTQTIKHAVIACHPLEKSFTLSVARRYAQTVERHGHEVVLRDLYRIGFDPVLKAKERRGKPAADIVREWIALGKPDVYVLVYPVWFGAPPAMLKGYIDRVFGAGRTVGYGGEGGSGELLAGKRLVSLTSSGSKRAWLAEKGVLASLRTVHDRYFAEVFRFGETHRFHFEGLTPDMPESDVQAYLQQVEKAAEAVVGRMTPGAPDIDPNRP